jgi:predicted SnoaL-like aldol condensation-catalyzing enzyme
MNPLADSSTAGALTEQADRRQLLADFAHQFYELRDVAGAFARYVREDYIQHSPSVADGRDAAVSALAKLANPDLQLAVRRILLDGDMAVLLVHGEVGEHRFGVVDIYRLEGDLIVEHWDVNQSYPPVLANAHPMFS